MDAVSVARYGHERFIFEQTLSIVRTLHLWINGSDFLFDDSREMAVRNAEELWNNFKFSGPTNRETKGRLAISERKLRD